MPTILTYGHGDTVRGLEEQWDAGLDPWTLTERGELWYGRGTADNKGQHAVNLSALEAVLEERAGELGFNVELVLETSEERGSTGLREFVAANREMLAADVLIASDGPRVMPEVPTIATGTRGTYHFDLVVDLRPGGVHSGHWGGLTTDPAVVLVSALGTIIDRHGKILVRDWLPQNGVPADGARCAGWLSGRRRRRSGDDRSRLGRAWPHAGGKDLWLEQFHRPGDDLRPARGAGQRRGAECPRALPDPLHGRYRPGRVWRCGATHLDAEGFCQCTGRKPRCAHAGKPHGPANPWVRWLSPAWSRTLGKRVQVIPNSSGGLPGDVFVDHLGTPLVWIPHSYNGCKQHGPDEHFLRGPRVRASPPLPDCGGISASPGSHHRPAKAAIPSRAAHAENARPARAACSRCSCAESRPAACRDDRRTHRPAAPPDEFGITCTRLPSDFSMLATVQRTQGCEGRCGLRACGRRRSRPALR